VLNNDFLLYILLVINHRSENVLSLSDSNLNAADCNVLLV